MDNLNHFGPQTAGAALYFRANRRGFADFSRARGVIALARRSPLVFNAER